MSMGNTTENDIMKLYFNATAIADYAENDTTSPHTDIAVSLHTADPGEAGTLSTNETSYTNYARVSVARTSGGWTVTNNSVSPVANISFAQSGSSATITHFATGKTGGGAAVLHFSGTVTPNIAVANGVTPILATSSTITLD
jgi:hypothetical protein